MKDVRLTRWKDVAGLLEQGWHVDGYYLISPTGERQGAWGNAIKACRDRGLIPSQPICPKGGDHDFQHTESRELRCTKCKRYDEL